MAIICSLNKDVLKTTNCGYSLPTVTDIYLANYADVTATAISASSEGEDEITGITMASGKQFYHIEPAKDSVTFTDDLATGTTGNKYRVVTLTFSVNGAYTKEMHSFLDAISLGKYFAVVKNAEGNYLAIARLTGVEASASSLAAGTDQNGITVTLTANVAESTMTLTDDAITVVVG